MIEKVLGIGNMGIGKISTHPEGYKVKIIAGQMYGSTPPYGLSNWWSWRKVLKNGKLSKRVYSGYGW